MNKLSRKQMQVLAFPYTKYKAIITDGSIRAGKTCVMSVAFHDWAMDNFSGENFIIGGESTGAAERNVVDPYCALYYTRKKYQIARNQSKHKYTLTRNGVTNTFFIFGGSNKRSPDAVQGLTAAGALFDEVALQERTFVEQAMGRCSVKGARLWFNCNPDAPKHWFNVEWIKQADKHKALHIHFLMDDNPSLDDETKEDYRNRYSGVFHRRFILGEWCVAEGVVYPNFDRAKNLVSSETINEWLANEKLKTKPPGIKTAKNTYKISMDYGTMNPCVMILWGKVGTAHIPINWFYHNGRASNRQMTDDEYFTALQQLCGGDTNGYTLIVDPSATSFITLCRQKHVKVRKAKNDVKKGIQAVSCAINSGKLLMNADFTECIDEFETYRWSDKVEVDEVVKEDDHCMDAIRYYCLTDDINKDKKPYQSIYDRR